METNKAIGYIRVSTADQEGSLEIQEKIIRDYCRFKNLDLAELFIDENISGFTPISKRPQGKLLLKSPIKNIVAIKPDRLFRNVKDALITVDQWNHQNIALHITDMGGLSFSTKTAIGRLMFTTVIAFAEFERNITGERTKAVLNNKRSQGKVYGGPVLGYDRIGDSLVPNPIEQETIHIIQTLSKTHNENRIARILNNTGFRSKSHKRFSRNAIQYILRNPIHS